jgi:hypothetical protein
MAWWGIFKLTYFWWLTIAPCASSASAFNYPFHDSIRTVIIIYATILTGAIIRNDAPNLPASWITICISIVLVMFTYRITIAVNNTVILCTGIVWILVTGFWGMEAIAIAITDRNVTCVIRFTE